MNKSNEYKWNVPLILAIAVIFLVGGFGLYGAEKNNEVEPLEVVHQVGEFKSYDVGGILIALTGVMLVILTVYTLVVLNRNTVKTGDYLKDLEKESYRVNLKFTEEVELDGLLSDTFELEFNGLEYGKFKQKLNRNDNVFEVNGKVFNKSLFESYSWVKLKE